MSSIAYETIAPNIAQVNVSGSQVQVQWKCPRTGYMMGTSTGSMRADSSLAGRVGADVKKSVASEVIYGAARALSGLFGGAAGRVISNATYTAASDINSKANSSIDYTESSRQAAIVAAFESVRSSFVWDDGRQQFVSPS